MQLLKEKNVKCQIVSVISEGLFRQQDAAYQAEILPKGIKRFGMTAGLPVNLEGLVGENGKVFGLSHFGYSAPASKLDVEFGYTPENVVKEVTELLA